MKANLPYFESLGEKVVAVLGLVTMTFMMYPETLAAVKVAQAQGTQEALVFEIDSNKTLNINTQTSITYKDIINGDPLVAEVVAYIKKKAPKSPLANPETVAHIISQAGKTDERDVWIRALAISFVESHMCTYTPKKNRVESHNCSGIVSGKGYKMYASYEDWFTDMTKLLQKPSYANRPLKAYLKYYVQPGSPRWYNGVLKAESELMSIHEKINTRHLALANNPNAVVAVSTNEIELVK